MTTNRMGDGSCSKQIRAMPQTCGDIAFSTLYIFAMPSFLSKHTSLPTGSLLVFSKQLAQRQKSSLRNKDD